MRRCCVFMCIIINTIRYIIMIDNDIVKYIYMVLTRTYYTLSPRERGVILTSLIGIALRNLYDTTDYSIEVY